MTIVAVVLVVVAAAYLVALCWALRDAPEVRAEVGSGHDQGQGPRGTGLVSSQLVSNRTPNIEKAAEIDWSRLPHEITRAVEAPDGPGVLIDQLTPGLGLAIDHDAAEAVVIEEGTGELVRIPLYRLRDIDQTLLLEALDDPRATEAAERGDLLADSNPKGDWLRVWVRGDEGRHWGVHRCCAVPGWPWGEE